MQTISARTFIELNKEVIKRAISEQQSVHSHIVQDLCQSYRETFPILKKAREKIYTNQIVYNIIVRHYYKLLYAEQEVE